MFAKWDISFLKCIESLANILLTKSFIIFSFEIFFFISLKIFKKEIITPGIRLNNKNNDQKRVITPKDAFKKGSSWLVIGRSLTKGNIKNNIKNLIDHLS